MRKFIPSPLSLAILLTIAVMLWAILRLEYDIFSSSVEVLKMWENGIWNESLLVFAVQMMLILVLGHILVLSKPVKKLLQFLTKGIDSTPKAVIVVSISTMIMAFFNWGLGLIFGAILVRQIGESCQRNGFEVNYPLVGAAGYIGLMVWHGGMSGSAPLKVAESGHLASITQLEMPEYLSTSTTIFSSENLVVFLVLLIIMPILFVVLDLFRKKRKPLNGLIYKNQADVKQDLSIFENSNYLASTFGILILVTCVVVYSNEFLSLRITPNILNFLILGMAFLLHRNLSSFLRATKEAIGDVSGILIQFPLYFGIMGIMKDSGLAKDISDFFVSVSTADTLPILSFISAGILNIFVPSGGGQWAIQGPIIIESSQQINVPLPKMIMAMAYGDQITNMLQPFWALPLLAITKLKAHEILPYTFWMFVIGSLIFIFSLIFIY